MKKLLFSLLMLLSVISCGTTRLTEEQKVNEIVKSFVESVYKIENKYGRPMTEANKKEMTEMYIGFAQKFVKEEGKGSKDVIKSFDELIENAGTFTSRDAEAKEHITLFHKLLKEKGIE